MNRVNRFAGLLVGLLLAFPQSAGAQMFVPADRGAVTQGTFEEITQKRYHTYGASWGDFDGDGDLDLFIANDFDGNQLIRNDEGFFRLQETFSNPGTAAGAVWSDLDNDGDLDLIVHAVSGASALYANQGNGTFLSITSPISEVSDARDAAVADADSDGWVDVLMVRRLGASNLLFRNQGNLVLVGSDVLPFDSNNSNSATWADYDGDGDTDLFVANSSGEQDRLYRNTGESFVLSDEVPVGPESSSSSSWGDYDGDGDLDLFVASAFGADKLYRNDGPLSDGETTFTPVSIPQVTDRPGLSNGSAWGDVDNDGDLDLVVTDREAPSWLYINEGGDRFYASQLGGPGYGVGPSLADYDNDGDLDLLVPKGVNTPLKNELFRNTTDTKHNWLQVRCVGTVSNRSAIGARVRVKASINGEPRWQVREVQTRSGRATQSGLRLHFGLGEAPVVDSVVVSWPSGIQQVLSSVEPNQILTITEEGEADIVTAGEGAGEEQVFAIEAVYPNPFTRSISIRVAVDHPGPVFVAVYDVLGRRVRTLLNDNVQRAHVDLSWDARDDGGHRLAAGTYFVRAVAAGRQSTMNVVLVR